jgi:hypothetical protein
MTAMRPESALRVDCLVGDDEWSLPAAPAGIASTMDSDLILLNDGGHDPDALCYTPWG